MINPSKILNRAEHALPKLYASESSNMLMDPIELRMIAVNWLLTPKKVALRVSQNDVPYNSAKQCVTKIVFFQKISFGKSRYTAFLTEES